MTCFALPLPPSSECGIYSTRYYSTFYLLISQNSYVNIFTIFQHWIANNLFGIAFAINGVELLQLNNVVTGCILLCGLFVYDIFWVFGTNVMVSVAKTFEAPIKCNNFSKELLKDNIFSKCTLAKVISFRSFSLLVLIIVWFYYKYFFL